MYVWLWRHLPGPFLVRVLQATVLLGLVVTALFLWVFPEVEARLPYQDVTVPSDPTPGATPSGSASPAPVVPGELPGEEVPSVAPNVTPTPSP